MNKKQEQILKVIRSNKRFLEILGELLPDGEKVPTKMGTKKMIPALSKTDISFQLLLVHPDDKIRQLCQARISAKSWPTWIKRIQKLKAQAMCMGGKMPINIKYYGAHTGRFSGAGGVNLLNLGGKGRGRSLHPLIGRVRNTIVAPDGYVFALIDSAQIEARELAWIAGQNDLIKDFADGKDIYSQFATELFQEKVWKPTEKEKETPEDKVADIRRGFGKDAILGCGYGMGANTFYDRCRQNDTLRPLFDKGEYNWDFINRLIKTYRTHYSCIPKFWNTIEKCFRFVTKYPNEMMTYYINDDGICLHDHLTNNKPLFKNTLLTFWVEGSTTIIQLPSGRRLFYRHAAVGRKGNIRYGHGKLWGGHLTENVIQAICRDLLGKWILDCEEIGIEVKLHSYDEIVAIVPEKYANEKLQEIINIMSVGPDWAAGLPLAAEGQLSKRYTK